MKKIQPVHLRGQHLHAPLSKELKKKHGRNAVRVCRMDKVKVLLGKFKGKEGTVERVHTKEGTIFLTKFDVTRKEGSKSLVPIRASNVVITELNLNDKRRTARVTKKA